MRQLIYVMQFTGQAGPTETAGVLRAQTMATSCRITSTVSDDGVDGVIEAGSGGSASFESTVTFTGDSSFLETGSIEFGAGNLLRFSTVGQGYLGASPDSTVKHGSIIWKVDSGESQFAGASGLITSNFTVGAAGEVRDNHFGVIYVK